MPAGSGRKSGSEWNEVSKNEDGKSVCQHCNEIVSSKIERIRVHLKKCKERKRSVSDTETDVPKNVDETVSTDESVLKKRKIQSSIKHFTTSTSISQKSELDKDVARFFFANNIPFSNVEHKMSKQMFENLRPGYKPPNRKQLSGPLLDEIAKEVDEKMMDELKNSSVTLLLDGWSSVKNDPIVAQSMHTGTSSYLLNAVDCGSTKKTAKKCFQLTQDAIQEIKLKYGLDVFAICTDNENKMKALKKLIDREYPNILTYGCSAHYLNLLESAVTPKSLLKHIVEVQKYFRKHHQPHGWLIEKNGMMPQIPNDTRWNSQKECIRTFLENFHKYNEIRVENDIDPLINNILSNVSIYVEANNLLKQLTIVGNALDLLQSDTTSISKAVDVWINLMQASELVNYQNDICKRFNEAIGPFHFLANITDPLYRGKRLNSDQELEAENWFRQKYPEYHPFLLHFQLEDKEYFSPNMFTENVIAQFSSAKWWKLMDLKTSKNMNLPVGFCTFFEKLHSCPSSSAGLERIFSTYGLIWTPIRNSLGVEKATKLVKVYRFLRKDEPEW